MTFASAEIRASEQAIQRSWPIDSMTHVACCSAAKSARITEGLGIQFRAEFFNVLNHTNLLTPNPVVFSSATSGISPTAGVISATSTTARQIQFGAKLRF